MSFEISQMVTKANDKERFTVRHTKSQQQLQPNQLFTLNNFASSTSFLLPEVNPIAISISICSSSNNASPNIVLKNGTSGSTTNIALTQGLGTFQGFLSKSSTLQIDATSGELDLEIGILSDSHLPPDLDTLPQVGDTTATQGIFFSPEFASSNHISPTFPNYTLPLGVLDPPSPPANPPNFTLILLPTQELSSQPQLSNSACGLQRITNGIDGAIVISPSSGVSDNGVNVTTSMVLKDIKRGWRFQWLVEGLQPSTNYTIWTILDGVFVAGPINTLTKSAWAIPLPPPPDGATTYTSTNLPTSIADPLISTITNFTIALLTLACGRDLYSPIQTCEDCAFAYRSWACAVSLPRCAEPLPNESSTTSSLKPALIDHPSEPVRTNLTLDNPSPSTPQITTYTELLPCIETCTLVDRACPPLFVWECPVIGVTANNSYGIGFIDALQGSGDGFGSGGVREGGGVALVESGNSAKYRYGTDRFGTAWCNGNG
ncbi:hypothetical protein Clacol_008647 [Clathrus columnatus]|uniref:Uncharacterized protein n=1 Tax=Clathrus columnatus TaxID=1419009 RepID=A0AAV5ANX9_9AGAM|nr:hypothetical protein Clacol_008647 [Clathrus columnatus]